MGEDFNFVEWSDYWLKTSGMNILEPAVVYHDGCIKSLAIKQTCDLRGKNRLRKQKLDIALYDTDFKPHVIKDIIISDTEELTPVKLEESIAVKAIIINHQDHAYAKLRFDQNTLNSFRKQGERPRGATGRHTGYRPSETL